MNRYEAFLGCRPVDRPLISPWRSGYYPAEQFPRGTAAWKPGEVLQPQDVCFDRFAADYEQLYLLDDDSESDLGYLGSAYWGIPWLEAIMGCRVEVAQANCCARPFISSLDCPRTVTINLDSNAWMQSLVEFTRELVKLAAGRFPVCPPLLRGPGDTLAAMVGEMAYITGFFDQPEVMRSRLEVCSRTRLEVLLRLQAEVPPWQGVHVAGGYPSRLMSRRTVAYHQEDSAAVLNPSIFREFILPALRIGMQAAEVNFIHLHSACLYHVDTLLQDDSFDVLQINIDHRGTGPAVSELIDTFKRIQAAGRPLLLWGEFSRGDWNLVRENLSPAGLSLQPIVRADEVFRW